MGWKNLPYWLKGGIIGGISGILLAILGQHFVLIRSASFLALILIYVFPVGHYFSPIIILIGLINFITYMILGALIGYIYGKIKNRK